MNVLIVNGTDNKLDLADIADELGISIVHNVLDDSEVAIFNCIKTTPAALDTANQVWTIGDCGSVEHPSIKFDDVTPDTIMEISDLLVDIFANEFDTPEEEE